MGDIQETEDMLIVLDQVEQTLEVMHSLVSSIKFQLMEKMDSIDESYANSHTTDKLGNDVKPQIIELKNDNQNKPLNDAHSIAKLNLSISAEKKSNNMPDKEQFMDEYHSLASKLH